QAVPRMAAVLVGCVMKTCSVSFAGGAGGGGAGVPLAPTTLTCIVVVPVRPAASRTEAVKVLLPFVPGVHGIVTGPRAAIVWLPTTMPFAFRVKAFADPLVPSTHSTTHAVPRRSRPPSAPG